MSRLVKVGTVLRALSDNACGIPCHKGDLMEVTSFDDSVDVLGFQIALQSDGSAWSGEDKDIGLHFEIVPEDSAIPQPSPEPVRRQYSFEEMMDEAVAYKLGSALSLKQAAILYDFICELYGKGR